MTAHHVMDGTISAALGRAKFAAPEFGARADWSGNDEDIFRQAARVSNHFDELTHVVDTIQRTRDAVSIRVLLKTYLIGWATLSDVVAKLLNDVFDLGYPDRDVSLQSVLRNKHVRAHQINTIFERHAQHVQLDRFKQLRNDIVHRGTLEDTELIQLEADQSTRALAAAFSANSTDRQQTEAAILRALHDPSWTTHVADFTSRRTAEYREHLRKTKDLLDELDAVLAHRVSNAA